MRWPTLSLTLVLALVVASVPGPPAASAQVVGPFPQAQIEAYVQERMERWKIPGLSLVVVWDGRVVHSGGYGYADLESGTPMTAETLVGLGSTGKGMTALAVLQLVERGEVELDAPVTRYLPEFKVADERGPGITVRQLLSHTAGLPASDRSAFERARGAEDDGALDRQVRMLGRVKLSRAPGSGWEYANDGFNVAGLIVQAVSGLSYEQYLAEHVFGPLGMARTTFDPILAAELGLAQGYVKRGDALVPEPAPFGRAYSPAGMVISDADDIARYLTALLDGGVYEGERIISEASLREMWRPMVTARGRTSYGLGWYVADQEGMRIVGHRGSIRTMGSALLLVPDLKLAVGVLANLSGDAHNDIASGLLGMLLGIEPRLRDMPTARGSDILAPELAV